MNANKGTNVQNNEAGSSRDNFLLNVDRVDGESKPKRAINFAEKIHFVLSHKDCRGRYCLTVLMFMWLPGLLAHAL